MNPTVAIVGSSVAGVRTAQALRREGHHGRIILLGQENALPYDKPPLSKQFLSGAWTAERTCLLSTEAAATDRIELRLGVAAEHLDIDAHQVVLADGEVVAYDTAVIATGASPRPSPWRPESGVHVLRTLHDSLKLQADLRRAGRIVIVGGGFIGAEVAATARAWGGSVTVVDPLQAPIGRVVGAEVGNVFTDLHRRNGVATRFGHGVAGIEGQAGDLRVLLTDGSTLPADTVVVGIGAVANDQWLAGSGLLVENGVVCDEFSRSVDVPDVFAAGDIACWTHPGHGERVRVEHWTNAVEQAANVAHNIMHPDDPRPYAPVEYVWSDQYDWKIQIAGRPAVAARHEVIGDLHGDHPRAAVLYEDAAGTLCGVATINWPRALARGRRLLADRVTSVDARMTLTAPTGAVR